MPHLQFDFNRKLSQEQKKNLSQLTVKSFSEIMDTGTYHIGISIREFDEYNLFLGQVKNQSEGVVLINIDLRRGRTSSQRKTLSLSLMDIIFKIINIPKENMYVIFTEHNGEDFNLSNKQLDDWTNREKYSLWCLVKKTYTQFFGCR